MTNDYLLSARVWSDWLQTQLLTPVGDGITSLRSIARSMPVSAPSQHTIVMPMNDVTAAGIVPGVYIEARAGYVSPTLWANGIVMDIAKSDQDGQISLTVADPMMHLGDVNNGPRFVTDLADGYDTVLEVLNGTHDYGQASTGKGRGFLDGTGWWGMYVAGPGWPQQPTPTKGKGRGDWGTSLQNVDTAAQIYAEYYRTHWGSVPSRGQLDFGPLGDDSGLVGYGGDKVADRLGLGYDSPTAWQAQQHGLITIASASYASSAKTVGNILWPLGPGHDDTMITLRHWFGDVFTASGALQPDVTAWQPNKEHGGTLYYLKTSAKQTFRGRTYSLIAKPTWEGGLMYGVIDLTSVAKYGPKEIHRRFAKAKDPDLLLAYALGVVYRAADPPPSWTFDLRIPWPANGTAPKFPLPGQSMQLYYEGWTHVTVDPYGVPGSDYKYLTYPNGMDTISLDADALLAVRRIMSVSDTLDETGYQLTVEMGNTRKKPSTKTVLMDLAKRMETHVNHGQAHPDFAELLLNNAAFLFTKSPTASVRSDTHTVTMEPGSRTVSDVGEAQFFGDGRKVSFTVNLQDENGCMDYMFAKPIGATALLTDVSGAEPFNRPPGHEHDPPMYAVFRVCGSKFQGSCGFYTTTDGVTYTHHGVEPDKSIFDAHGRAQTGLYRFEITNSGGIYEAHGARIDYAHENIAPHRVWAHWTDKVKQITTFGAIGWHYHGGSQNGYVTRPDFHPYHRPSNVGQGGIGNSHYFFGLDGKDGLGVGTQGDPLLGSVHGISKGHHFQGGGKSHHKDDIHHGPHHPPNGKIASVSSSGGLVTVLFDVAHPPFALAGGVLVYNALDGTYVKVKHRLVDGKKQVTGFATGDPIAATWQAGTTIFWDPLDSADDNFGHRRSAIYSELHGGLGIIDIPANGDERKALVVFPDGFIGTLGGERPLTQADGKVISLADLAADAAQIALGFEHDGAALFDAGALESTTQMVYAFPGASNPILTPSSVINSDPTGFFDQKQGPTTAAGCWLSQTNDGQAGHSDAILQLTAGTFGGSTYTTVCWFDTVIREMNGTNRNYTVRRDSSFLFPVYAAYGGSPSTLRMGAQALVTMITGSVYTVNQTVGLPGAATAIQTSIGDVWLVGYGTANAEKGIVTAIDSNARTITFSGLVKSHAAKDKLVMYSTKDLSTGLQVVVNSMIKADGSQLLEGVVPAIDVIAVGFYAKDIKTGSYDWYRAFWGDPSWQCPYLGAVHTTDTAKFIPHIGPIPGNPSAWLELLCKASQMTNGTGKKLWSTGSASTLRIEGVELAIYSAVPGVGQTVYFDAHQHGHVAAAGKVPQGTVNEGGLGKESINTKHKNPTANNDAHFHSDLHYWCDKSFQLHWENGSLVLDKSDGSQGVYTINGCANQDHPNAGIAGKVGAQPSAAGNYLLFNTSATPYTVKTSWGNVTIPAYSASGGTGGQTRGFAVVPEDYDLTARVGGGSVKNGLPPGVCKVGKINKSLDDFTGELHLNSNHGAAKSGGKTHRKGSIPPKANHPSHPAKHIIKNLTIRVTGSS